MSDNSLMFHGDLMMVRNDEQGFKQWLEFISNDLMMVNSDDQWFIMVNNVKSMVESE